MKYAPANFFSRPMILTNGKFSPRKLTILEDRPRGIDDLLGSQDLRRLRLPQKVPSDVRAVVASFDNLKVESSKHALRDYFAGSNIDVKDAKTRGLKSGQLLGYDEIAAESAARLRSLEASTTHRYEFNLQNGALPIFHDGHWIYLDAGLSIVRNRETGVQTSALTGGVSIPAPYLESILRMPGGLQRNTAGSFMGSLLGCDPRDWHRYVTEGALSRGDLLAQGLFLALAEQEREEEIRDFEARGYAPLHLDHRFLRRTFQERRLDIDKVFNALSEEPSLAELYRSATGTWEGYTLREHTRMVLGQFERYFSCHLQDPERRSFLRAVLALHAIGKPLAIQAGDVSKQHRFTNVIVKGTLAALRFRPEEVLLATALLKEDVLGDFIKTGNFEETESSLRRLARESGHSLRVFYDFLKILYLCDASSYTKDAGGLVSLDRLFEVDGKTPFLDLTLDSGARGKFALLEYRLFSDELSGGEKLWMVGSAEPFGFGPAAAMAEIAGSVLPRYAQVSFMGQGHTRDLQFRLPYQNIYDIGAQDPAEYQARIAAIFQKHQVFATATDFDLAALAMDAGLQVIIYDPLTWYWAELPKIIRSAACYIAQNFIGVEERIRRERDKFPENVVIIPPLVHRDPTPLTEPKNSLLINLGGLRNPYFDIDALDAYASFVLQAFRPLEGDFEAVTRATSRELAQKLSAQTTVGTYSPEEIQAYQRAYRLSAITPGLGNIYEASAARRPTILLPPTNDSQGQQLALLRSQGFADYAIDWHDLLDIEPIDYFARQPEVMKRLQAVILQAASSPEALENFSRRLREAEKGSRQNPLSKTRLSRLIEVYGSDGKEAAAEEIVRFLKLGGKNHLVGLRTYVSAGELRMLDHQGLVLQTPFVEQSGRGYALAARKEDRTLTVVTRRSADMKANSAVGEGADSVAVLRKNGFHFAVHTTRPENLVELLKSAELRVGDHSPASRQGDPMGNHESLFLHLLHSAEPGVISHESLLGLTGNRFPILVFSSEILLDYEGHLSTSYLSGGYSDVSSEKGEIGFSASLTRPDQVAESIASPSARKANEIVLTGMRNEDSKPRLPLSRLEKIFVEKGTKETVLQQLASEPCPKDGASWEDLVVEIEPFYQRPQSPEFQLIEFAPYSANSSSILRYALRHIPLSLRSFQSLLRREYPGLAKYLSEDFLAGQGEASVNPLQLLSQLSSVLSEELRECFHSLLRDWLEVSKELESGFPPPREQQ